jgi:peptidoglycan biosynthesis protein MviN/MurJ (putative lipid II flippase)
LAIPRTGTNVTTQFRLLFFHGFATTLGPGVLSAYLFAQKITDAVVQVIQQSVTTASLPVLSRDITEQKVENYTYLVRKYVVLLGGIGVAASAILYVVSDNGIRLLYGTTGSKEVIAYFLTGFLLALPFQMMSAYYVVSLYSARDTKDVFMTYLLSSFLGVGTVLLFKESGTQSLIVGYIVFWITNFLIILSLYSRKKI